MKHPFSGISDESIEICKSTKSAVEAPKNPAKRQQIGSAAAAASTMLIFGCKTTSGSDTELSDSRSNSRRRRSRPGTGVSTEAVGEEGGDFITTQALGEEGGGYSTTEAVGEEGGGFATTEAVGEEGGGDSPTDARGENGDRPRITTQALGEEGDVWASTEAVGEEGGDWASTEAVGEEGGWVTSQALGEEGADDRRPQPGRPEPIYTTQAVGEEGGGRVTTRRNGEEGGGNRPRPPRISTEAVGEEGGGRITSMAVGEEGGRGMNLTEEKSSPDDLLMTTMATGEEGGDPDWWKESNEKAAFNIIHQAVDALMVTLKELTTKPSQQASVDPNTKLSLVASYFEGEGTDKKFDQKIDIYRAYFEVGFYDAKILVPHVFSWRKGDGRTILDDSDNTFFYSVLQTLQYTIRTEPSFAAQKSGGKVR